MDADVSTAGQDFQLNRGSHRHTISAQHKTQRGNHRHLDLSFPIASANSESITTSFETIPYYQERTSKIYPR